MATAESAMSAAAEASTPLATVMVTGYDVVFGVNVRGGLFVTQAVGATMIKDGVRGRIVNVASTAGVQPMDKVAISRLPRKRLGRQEHLDGALALLPSGAEARLITGAVITVDDGFGVS